MDAATTPPNAGLPDTPPSTDPPEMPPMAMDAPAVNPQTPAPCSELQLLTLSEPTVALQFETPPRAWPSDDRVVIPQSYAYLKLGITVTNTSTEDMSLVGVGLRCFPEGQARIHNGGSSWFKPLPGESTMEATATIQPPAGELDCQWVKLMGEKPSTVEGCVVEARNVHLSIVVE
jgi:hypothetical protein